MYAENRAKWLGGAHSHFSYTNNLFKYLRMTHLNASKKNMDKPPEHDDLPSTQEHHCCNLENIIYRALKRSSVN